MKEDGQSNEPRKLSRGEKIRAGLYAFSVSLLFAYFLLGSAEGIRSHRSFGVFYDIGSQEAKAISSGDDLVVEAYFGAGNPASGKVYIWIEKKRSWFSYLVALLGGGLLFVVLWKRRLSDPGPEPWDPDLRG